MDVFPRLLALVAAALMASAAPAVAQAAGPPGFGPYAALLCHFADEEPDSPAEDFRVLMGNQQGSLGAYFDEVSYGLMRWEGSDAYGWLELPHDRAHYTGEDWRLRFELLDDCIAAADDDIYFPEHAGIVVQIAHGFGERVATGLAIRLALDGGPEQRYGLVELSGIPPTVFLLTHEIGHTLGLLHSMNTANSRPYGPMGFADGHYVGPYKVHLGWIMPEQIVTPPPASSTSIFLERLARPAGGGPLLARIPSRQVPDRHYTLEAHAPVGFDITIGKPTILMYSVEPSGFIAPHGPDITLIWAEDDFLPRGADMYGDSLEGLYVDVDSVADTGIGLTVTRGWPLDLAVEGEGRIEGFGEPCEGTCRRVATDPGAAVELTAHPAAGLELERWLGDCTGRDRCVVELTDRRAVTALFLAPLTVTAEVVAQAILGGPPLDPSTATRLDRRGNDNDALDLGDLRAWVTSR